MSYWTNKLVEEGSLLNRPCWYQKPYSEDITFAQIKEVKIDETKNCKAVTCILTNGVTAVLHIYSCPDWIGNKVWGFLTEAECTEYWDM